MNLLDERIDPYQSIGRAMRRRVAHPHVQKLLLADSERRKGEGSDFLPEIVAGCLEIVKREAGEAVVALAGPENFDYTVRPSGGRVEDVPPKSGGLCHHCVQSGESPYAIGEGRWSLHAGSHGYRTIGLDLV